LPPLRAMLFYSLNPLWSALIGRLVLGDFLETRTIAACGCALVAILLTFLPSLLFSAVSDEGSTLAGDIVAVATGLSQSAYICNIRAAARRDPSIDMLPASVAGSFVAAVLVSAVQLWSGRGGLLPGDTLSPSPEERAGLLAFFGLMVADALCVAVLMVCLTLAPRYISGAEVSLVTLLETPLAPFTVFLWFGEAPGQWTLLGGALLLATLAAHEAAGMDTRKKRGEESKLETAVGRAEEGGETNDKQKTRAKTGGGITLEVAARVPTKARVAELKRGVGTAC
jgi:drug/metabolite transporter (DMT)-like permease